MTDINVVRKPRRSSVWLWVVLALVAFTLLFMLWIAANPDRALTERPVGALPKSTVPDHVAA